MQQAEQEPSERTAQILRWLDRQQSARPAEIGQGSWDYAIRYTQGRYAIGLAHYQKLFHGLGWSGKRHGLDIGSGAGHWTIAFTLDNERATGVDPAEEFVHLANGAAAATGLGGRVRHQHGRAEALDFPDGCFDAVWSHSVLQYCDIEDSIGEVARVLEPDGEFYCGYSSIGFRLGAIYSGVASRQQQMLRAQLENYIGACLQRDGMAHTPFSQLRAPDLVELTAVCRAFGLRPLRHPGLQDASADFAGIPGTIDLLCVRDGEAQGLRTELLDLSPASESGRRRYHELVRLGLGKLVQGILDARGDAMSDRKIRSLYVLAGLRAGRGEAMAALADDGVDPLVRGLAAFDGRRIPDGIASFGSLPSDHPDRSFLLGAALLYAGERDRAVIEFERGVAAKLRPVECGLGAMLARTGLAGWPEQCDRMVRVFRLLPEALGASAEKIDRLIGGLVAAA